MTSSTLTDLGLTLPEALMPFLHTDGGQPYRSVKPDALAAAAELTELVALGLVRIDDARVVGTGAPLAEVAGARPWMSDVLADLRAPVKVRSWLRSHDALATQQAAAVERGLLTPGRGRLLGVVGYDRHDVAPGVRERLLVDVLETPDDTRSQALARLLVKSGLHRRHGITTDQRRRLGEIAERAAQGPLPEPTMSALDLALVSVVYTTTISE